MAHCVMQGVLYLYREKCIHIGVGFDVARSTMQGNAKASVRGTSDEEIPRLPFYLNFSACFYGVSEAGRKG